MAMTAADQIGITCMVVAVPLGVLALVFAWKLFLTMISQVSGAVRKPILSAEEQVLLALVQEAAAELRAEAKPAAPVFTRGEVRVWD